MTRLQFREDAWRRRAPARLRGRTPGGILLVACLFHPTGGGRIGEGRGRPDFEMPYAPGDVIALEDQRNDRIGRVAIDRIENEGRQNRRVTVHPA